jgi:hypothetical protein
MLKKASGCVLASFRGSTYRKKYASPLHLLRPCQKAFLNILLLSGIAHPAALLESFFEHSLIGPLSTDLPEGLFEHPAIVRHRTPCGLAGRLFEHSQLHPLAAALQYSRFEQPVGSRFCYRP